MNRKIAGLLTLLLLIALYVLRESPIVVLAASLLIGVAGLVGVDIWRDDRRRWRMVSVATVVVWFIIRAAIDGAPRALFVGEGLLLVLAFEFVRIQDWAQPLPSVPALTLASLLCVMQQRVSFTNLGMFSLLGILVVVSVAWFATQARVSQRPEFARKRISVALAILGVAGFASFKVSEVWGEQLSVIENRVDMWLATFAPETQIRPYPRSGGLNTITLEKLREPESVALRVYSNRAPGYITGQVFDIFNTRAWFLYSPQYRASKDRPGFDVVQPSNDSGIRVPQGESIFLVAEESPSDGFSTYEISNVPGRGNSVFAPRGTQYIRGYGENLKIDDYGVVRSGLNTESKYYAYVNPRVVPLSPDDMSTFLVYIPPELRPEFSTLSKSIVGEATEFDEKVNAIKAYMATGFAYSLRSNRDLYGAALLRDFLKKKQGHCELFATATALLLRSQGIMSRYVTGYTCTERDPDDDDYWAALNRNCHAWVEAWNPEEEKWVLVETTPGMSTEAAAEALNSESDAPLEDEIEMEAGSSASTLSSRRWIRAVQWGGLILTTVMLIWTWMRFSERGSGSMVANPGILRLDKKLAKHGLSRKDGETLHEFADRVEMSPTAAIDLDGSAQFYRDYANLLYGGRDEELAQLPLPAGV